MALDPELRSSDIRPDKHRFVPAIQVQLQKYPGVMRWHRNISEWLLSDPEKTTLEHHQIGHIRHGPVKTELVVGIVTAKDIGPQNRPHNNVLPPGVVYESEAVEPLEV